MPIFFITVRSAGRRFECSMCGAVSRGGYILGFLCAAHSAGICFNAARRTGRRLCDRAAVPSMTALFTADSAFILLCAVAVISAITFVGNFI